MTHTPAEPLADGEMIMDEKLSEGATAFLRANKRSPVVSGSAIGQGGEGCHYELKNGQTFTLSREQCQEVGQPRWLGVPNHSRSQQ